MIFLRKFKKFVAHFFGVLNTKTLIDGQMVYAFVKTQRRDSNT
ncbi:hypothetical protein SAMN05444387_4657 [Flavobacterium pectinovorum]|jgi:hypothetical protein|uniref:Transposase n=1 Tax=Flavobacterium pectinovorum TaxID=29533 RepID=A0ABY1J9W2_9FLAO|nr:hypothetical protein SAMN05444387_4657 [Flavobacterium pectinovorum]